MCNDKTKQEETTEVEYDDEYKESIKFYEDRDEFYNMEDE